ncbi:phosphohydrolase [Rhodococcus sp. SRB_17]|nr:phosphohydrolase [Rhodococcus sp. SRB_17]
MKNSLLIDPAQLRVGMFVQLDIGWMHHPFPVSSFRISSSAQIDTLRSLGLEKVRYFPEKGDFFPNENVLEKAGSAGLERGDAMPEAQVSSPIAGAVDPSAQASGPSAYRQSLARCDQRFMVATQRYCALVAAAADNISYARDTSRELVSECVDALLHSGDSVIRLLSEGVGERSALHPVNVMVLSLLLGKAQGMAAEELQDLGLAALLHDLGKMHLRQKGVWTPEILSAAELALYQSHVGKSVALAQRMGFSSAVLTAIAQHHEMADGSGFPLHLLGDDMGKAGRILAVVNRYDGLCNPARAADALTPHEALSVLFAQFKGQFEAVTLGAFIRMMGVYPPGSIVQLVNDQFAIVLSVNSSRPLRPKVMVHDPRVPQGQAPVLDLESVPELGIRRSLKPAQLPRAALDYLSPRERICYFFDRAVDTGSHGADL